jgi:hypothetical protein
MSQQFGLTSLVANPLYAKQLGISDFYYRYRSCNSNFPNRTQTSVGGLTPADQYQKLKLIQNTVRVYGSLYTANLGPLTAYKKPISDPNAGLYGVCWNQMSDRPVPSVQNATVPTGYNVSTINRRHTSVTSSRPGCQTPGGIGCDIKHNSYDRYLNRIKGKGPMRRGVVPPTFGDPIPFNPAFPVYGGKTTKTNIVDGCNCPIDNKNDVKLYDNQQLYPYPSSPPCQFNVGTYVYAKQDGNDFYTRAIVLNNQNDIYTIEFDNGTIQTVNNSCELLIYFPCNCNAETKFLTFEKGLISVVGTDYSINCSLPISLFNNLVN